MMPKLSGMDKCNRCKTAPRVVNPYCRACNKAINDACRERRRAGDPEAWRAKQRQYGGRSYMKAKYGITLEIADVLLAGGCDICGEEATEIDHNHETGELRGGLCYNCNLGLGHFKDSPERLRSAATYVAH